ncbi:MAG: VanZ family protein [candidate division KSB1 bacterium]|nr:VanZ family protein [candidate division KSB1 bacterium]
MDVIARMPRILFGDQGRGVFLFLFWGCAAAILFFSVTPGTVQQSVTGDEGLLTADQGFYIHSLAYSVLLLLGVLAFQKLFGVSIAVLAYSCFCECLQIFIPFRKFNPDDMMANGFGILFALVLFGFVKFLAKEKT